MVSNASDDLAEPESPVMTTSSSRGISRSMFLRLCSRAPLMTIRSLAMTGYSRSPREPRLALAGEAGGGPRERRRQEGRVLGEGPQARRNERGRGDGDGERRAADHRAGELAAGPCHREPRRGDGGRRQTEAAAEPAPRVAAVERERRRARDGAGAHRRDHTR